MSLLTPWVAAGTPGVTEETLHAWARRERPAALRALTGFVSEDGRQALRYAQWASDGDYLAWLSDHGVATHDGLVRYAVYRGYRPPRAGPARMLATPLFATDGPAVQRALADAVVAVLAELRPAGLVGAHFHVSLDGRRVVNYAEWEDAAAWQAFIEGAAAGRMRAAFRATAGVTPLNTAPGVARYRLCETA